VVTATAYWQACSRRPARVERHPHGCETMLRLLALFEQSE